MDTQRETIVAVQESMVVEEADFVPALLQDC